MGKIKEVCGVKFIEPDGYEVTENGVFVRDGRSKFIKINISHAPLFITGRAINENDGTEEVEIAFKRGDKLVKLWVCRSVICIRRKLMKLVNHGLPILSKDILKIIEYFAAFEADNMDIIKVYSQSDHSIIFIK